MPQEIGDYSFRCTADKKQTFLEICKHWNRMKAMYSMTCESRSGANSTKPFGAFRNSVYRPSFYCLGFGREKPNLNIFANKCIDIYENYIDKVNNSLFV